MPLLGTMDGRHELFQQLKPPCVALSQTALALNASNPNIELLTSRLEDVHKVLANITDSYPLDARLADYVFFPLSQVLKASQKVSIRCLELTFQSLAILIHQGWSFNIQPQLAAQIVILCTMVAEKEPKGLSFRGSTDDLQTSALKCLYRLFDALSTSGEARNVLTSEANVPQLGQTISIVLDALVEGRVAEVQIAAMHALTALVDNVADRDIQAAFLPGIVSKLTKVVTPSTKQRRAPSIITDALHTLQQLFSNTLRDTVADHVTHSNGEDGTSKVINDKWLQSAATQLAPAIATIVKLKDHSRVDVREALSKFCFTLIKDCRKTLKNSVSLAFETILFLACGDRAESVKFSLESLATTDGEILELLQVTLHDWLRSLATRMQSADEQAKVQRMQQIRTAYSILVSTGTNTTTIDKSLAQSLRDSVVITIQLPGPKLQPATMLPVQSLDLTFLSDQHRSMAFTSPLVQYKGQESVLHQVERLVQMMSSTSASGVVTKDLSRMLRLSDGETRLATFWMLLESAKTASKLDHDSATALLDFEDGGSRMSRSSLEELYSLALTILTDPIDESPDQRLQALSIQAIALRAQAAGKDFRHELIDALYPILHTLATPDESLQQHSVAALNIFSDACGYSSVEELIVDNVDYLTNAVALKLNSFDVSPQAPQVLLMMVKLAGPTLLPYLEDTIDSIFAALEDYHGYPLLVELLFKVLGVVTEEGAKAPQLAIEDSDREKISHVRQERWQPTSVTDLVDLLQERSKNIATSAESAVTREAHPQRPWKSMESGDQDEDHTTEDDEVPPVNDVEVQPPAPKTFALLLKISELTQHFLPSASASLRTSLLGLIKTATPAIARHENSFLPLINTLWPEIISRLDDPEPQVVATALDIIALLCEHASGFMRSRIAQLWPGIVEQYQSVAKHVMQSMTSSKTAGSHQPSSAAVVPNNARLKHAVARFNSRGPDYADSSVRLVWSSLIDTITKIVRYVPISPESFDEALEMLAPVMETDNVKTALAADNADAVWLVCLRAGLTKASELPRVIQDVKWASVDVGG
ncbi:TEL2-interacting protein 1 [Fulvia fulva]|uniref:TEL2-interacting protein 1 n=1 Tax=Passalora fulva TaxID=5499 RepID=A0A9Q8LJ16_PASFU|nr:TEL2-interacting protein 1 [Fulvia fulva]KAK4623783.1 TEL2-interacting protein 1 [Fulvia fulva]KAK4625946.1 TEL2-interacting protein 1 [Fulvia fulva]UJO18297.1 TEL2-interacting protein 1 [Fulvia fulva]WPV15204.1 TEL2-interacting protein 1 [Fulvia fulva]WPV29935.1 TEL2-interacting protein 1 [Fulvia fulva]